jgi:hypothetical protein
MTPMNPLIVTTIIGCDLQSIYKWLNQQAMNKRIDICVAI